jgi:hypothetical protein
MKGFERYRLSNPAPEDTASVFGHDPRNPAEEETLPTAFGEPLRRLDENGRQEI